MDKSLDQTKERRAWAVDVLTLLEPSVSFRLVKTQDNVMLVRDLAVSRERVRRWLWNPAGKWMPILANSATDVLQWTKLQLPLEHLMHNLTGRSAWALTGLQLKDTSEAPKNANASQMLWNILSEICTENREWPCIELVEFHSDAASKDRGLPLWSRYFFTSAHGEMWVETGYKGARATKGKVESIQAVHALNPMWKSAVPWHFKFRD